MAVDIVVPSPGESITEGVIARWAKKNGAFVRTDDLLFELDSDKATVPVNAECDGILTILVPEGQTTRLLMKIVTSMSRWLTLWLSVGDLIMARRQLLNLKTLAERNRPVAD